ncbi:MAG: hypothetical protein HWN69_08075 [Desulfobacterales bacterium]|nr:hypothetical protein [Desulfobacterales bacterium]
MAERTSPHVKSPNIGKYVFLAGFCIVLIGIGVWFILRPAKPPRITSAPQAKRMTIPPEKIIDYDKIKEKADQTLTTLMEERKAPYGVKKSLDMIVKPDESIRVGEETVQMKNILDKVRLKLGEIIETDLGDESKSKSTSKIGQEALGIHVVKPGENIWDIHFKLLTDYYDNKGIHLSPVADEPDSLGYSTGVGKILKFSENLVHIYNLRKRRLETNLDLIYPLSKIVIYNMSRIFSLLDGINYKNVNRIEFDGQTLWLPAVQ